MHIRNRVKELWLVRAGDLRPHPLNWRTHPAKQQDVLRGVLAEIGYAGALLARELEDGALELIDGHLRAETTPDAEVPVLVLDLNEQEAKKLLATHDPLAALAGQDDAQWRALLADVDFANPAVQGMLGQLSDAAAVAQRNDNPICIPESWQVVVECDSESHQQALYEQLTAAGHVCRLLTM